MALVFFEYELEANIIEVEATVEPGRPMSYPDMNGPGEPAEEPTVEIGDCYLRGEDGLSAFDPDGIYYRKWASTEMVCVLDEMEDKAFQAWENGQ